MRVLLLSANTGEGHNSTAKALMEILEERDVRCDLRDALSCLSPGFSKFICSCHSKIYRYAPKLSDIGYRAAERTTHHSESSPLYDLLCLGTPKLWDLLMARDYDGVICVHPFSAMMMTGIRRIWGLKVPCFFIATDYTCSPTVEQNDMDGYFIPAGDLTGEFMEAGLPAGQLFPYGIPVRKAFCQQEDQKKARILLGLPEEDLVMLIMCGSMGCGPIQTIARTLAQQLSEKATVVAICGNNTQLYDTLQASSLPHLQVVGYTTQIARYMDAADMIITKPGGLTVTEAANKHMPTVLINTVGGCESKNFSYFLDRGYALGSTHADEAMQQAITLAVDDSLRQQIRQTLAQAFCCNAAKEIANHVIAEGNSYRLRRKHDSHPAGIDPACSGNPLFIQGGDPMDNQPKLTVTNLARSFAGESQARTRYTIYAQIARQENQEWIARVFEQTAANEAVHAEEFLEHLKRLGASLPNLEFSAGYPYQLGTTEENLKAAMDGELHEHDHAYPEFSEVARREGFDDTARLWMQIARIEGVHHNVFRQLHEQLVSGTLTEKSEPIAWRCLNCGYTYESIRSCDPCPVCGKNAGWQEGALDEKQPLPKKSEGFSQ